MCFRTEDGVKEEKKINVSLLIPDFFCDGCRILAKQEINGTKKTQGNGTIWYFFYGIVKENRNIFFQTKIVVFVLETEEV